LPCPFITARNRIVKINLDIAKLSLMLILSPSR
jgi:hypothetical protein